MECQLSGLYFSLLSSNILPLRYGPLIVENLFTLTDNFFHYKVKISIIHINHMYNSYLCKSDDMICIYIE